MRTRARILALVAVLVVAAGCTDDAAEPATVRAGTPEPPAPFVATGDVPRGWPVTQCSDLRARDNTGLATRFGVPPTYSWLHRDGPTCGFGAGIARELYVALDPAQTLAAVKEREVDPFTGPDQGDGQLGEVEYAAAVPVFGDQVGERLGYYCYCDGQRLDYLVLQAGGVRLTWISPHGRPAGADDLAAVTDSLALLRSDRSICSARGLDRAASYAPPVPQTESVDGSGGGCHLYLRPGRGSLQRYAEIVPEPRRTLGQLAEGLRDDPHVTSARVDGKRLTWRYRERGTTYRGLTVLRDGIQVTWSATPRQWRQEADVYRTFVGSVRLLSR
ncbi:hypothetical protein [Nocardioides caricicola]|uniref:DUF3558 domain-containing protein n=1 Tax=Nocardioides caricicola TaxID=634770 RepID=A0ABW0N536_9ACTN